MSTQNKIIQNNAISLNLFEYDIKPTIDETEIFENIEYLTLRTWQQKAFDDLIDKKYGLVKAATGSGKSILIQSIVWKKLKQNKKLFCVIVVPQEIIGQSFKDIGLKIDDEHVNWSGENVTEEDSVGGCKGFRLLQKLKNRNSIHPEARIFICCYQTSINAYNKNKKAFHNILFVYDECHHLQCQEFEELDDYFNKAGKIANDVFEHKANKNQLLMSSATDFRSNKAALISSKYMKLVKKVVYPFDEFLINDCNIQSFKFDYILYPAKFTDGLTKVMSQCEWKKTIIYVPSVGSTESHGHKNKDVLEVLKAISNCEKPEIKYEGIFTFVKREDLWLRFIDLVDVDDRSDKKKYIQLAHNSENDDMLDGIIALNMFKEGANWKYATRSFIIGNKRSLVELLQTMGRLFRKANGKTDVEFYHLLPWSLCDIDEEDSVDKFNDIMKSICLSLCIEDLLMPSVKLLKSNKNNEAVKKDPTINYLNKLANEQNDLSKTIIEEIFRNVAVANHDNPEMSTSLEVRKTKQLEVVKEIIDSYSDKLQDFDKELLATQIYTKLSKRANTVYVDIKILRQIDQNLVEENFELIPLGIMGFTSEITHETFQQLKEKFYRIIGCNVFPFEEARIIVRQKKFKHALQYKEWVKTSKEEIVKKLSTKPGYHYKNWTNWPDFLGTKIGYVKKTNYLPFEKLKAIVQKKKFKSCREYSTWVKTSKEKIVQLIPSALHTCYGNQWKGYPDFLGTKTKTNFLPFEELRTIVQKKRFKNMKEYRHWVRTSNEKSVKLAPSKLKSIYKKQWISFEDFFGNSWYRHETQIIKNCLTFEKAREFVRKKKFKNKREYAIWHKTSNEKIIQHLPYCNFKKFFKKWKGINDFLGTTKSYLPFEEARRIVRKKNFKSQREYSIWIKTSKEKIVQKLHLCGGQYKDQWTNWPDFLGSNNWSPKNAH